MHMNGWWMNFWPPNILVKSGPPGGLIWRAILIQKDMRRMKAVTSGDIGIGLYRPSIRTCLLINLRREQLAGDLLPNPTDDQLIATAFHRNTMNNDEGGTDDEEFRVAALIDRVNTTWEVWQSTTLGCVQCHTHPYDPFVHEEYYKSMAFFNNTRDEDTPGEHPTLRMYKPEDQKKLEAIKSWVQETAGQERAKEVNDFLRTLEPKYHPHNFDQFVTRSASRQQVARYSIGRKCAHSKYQS